MILSGNARALLNACAKAMARGEHDIELDLSVLKNDFKRAEEEIIANLALGVEEASGHQRTVRRGDYALFAHEVQGQALYLVTCKFPMSADVITELTDDMVLYIISPHNRGFWICERASQEEVDRKRAFTAESNRRYDRISQCEKEIKEFLAELHEAVKARIVACQDSERRADAEDELRYTPLGVSFNNIAGSMRRARSSIERGYSRSV